MQQINARGTYLMSKNCLPYLKKSRNPHILNLSPPLNMSPRWFGNHTAYTMAKYGMSMCVLGMSEEFADLGISVNALWPKTSIATAAVKYALGGDRMMNASRSDQIMADSAFLILSTKAGSCTGNFFIDEEVLRDFGVTDFKKYLYNPSVSKEEDLMLDLFLEEVGN